MIRSTPTVKAIEGQRLQVACPASGYPIEQITWQKGKQFPLSLNFILLYNFSCIYLKYFIL